MKLLDQDQLEELRSAVASEEATKARAVEVIAVVTRTKEAVDTSTEVAATGETTEVVAEEALRTRTMISKDLHSRRSPSERDTAAH